MKIAYFDCQVGAAGDMLLGALLGAGLPYEKWRAELNKVALPAGSFEVELVDVIRGTVACKKLEVFIPDAKKGDHSGAFKPTFATARAGNHGHTHGPGHAHDHTHDHSHSHGSNTEHEHHREHENGSEHGHPHPHTDGTRHLSDVLQIIDSSSIAPQAKSLAARIFERLAVAEAKVHGTSKDNVHFHEVGAVDAIVDIVGFSIGYVMLGIERSYVSAVPIGSGFVKAAHGTLAVPGPAVLYLLTKAGASTLSTEHSFECLTPTGAAILAEVAHRWGAPPSFNKISAVGYGAGTKDPLGWPNACRLVLGAGSEGSSRYRTECVAIIETNVDDLSPQAISYAVNKLFAAGALDVVVLPAVMKKGRSGHLIQVISTVAERSNMEELLLAETTAIGARSCLVQRVVAEREWVEIVLKNGDVVRVKVSRDKTGEIVNALPEFDDCEKYATTHGVPLKDVFAEVVTKYRQEPT